MRRAFTLIELLIALAIGTFVVAALYGLFSVQLRQFVYQDLQMEMHQNVRLALDILSRTGRTAGLGTTGRIAGALGVGGSEANNLPTVISYDGTGPGGSDGITIVSQDPNLIMFADPDELRDCTDATVAFDLERPGNADKVGEIAANEFLLCSDLSNPQQTRSMMWVTQSAGDATTGSVTVTDGTTAYADFTDYCQVGENMPTAMQCSRADVITFYIDADESDGIGSGSAEHPVLMMDLDFESPDDDDVPVVDNVEDLQVEYCFFATDCSSTDSAGWVNTVDSYSDTNTGNDPDDLTMMRFTIVVRSSREDLNHSFAGARLSIGNNTPSTDADHYYRQVLAAEVTVRNMRVLSWL
ncbi:MAG: prepilin-type N-terminal cleavage/methylation domain-containing protein [Myxococcales bacterium]|nr:prepilin-type N-terminal cleavage/methylation domain-containing protein [Myxococcales bacterium]